METPAKQNSPKVSQLEMNDPALFAHLVDKVAQETQTLLVQGEQIKPVSNKMIASFVAENYEQFGQPLTREAIDAMGSDLQDLIIKGAVARVDMDNTPGDQFAVIDESRGEVLGTGSSKNDVRQTIEEGRQP